MKIPLRLKFCVRAIGNLHRPGSKPDILLFATPRGGSTWLMEILSSQPGMKFFDEPLNPRRDYAAPVGLTSWEQLMPDTGEPEWVIDFLRALQRGKKGALNPTMFTRNHRFVTNRIVFKIHEIEHLMRRVTRECGARAVYLVRHPIANSISRHQLPRLPVFLQSAHYAGLIGDEEKLGEIRSLGSSGSYFQKAIVSWCFENIDALRFKAFDGLLVTYEELVLNPERACDLLLSYFEFSDREAMLGAFERPAENIGMSNRNTIDVMQSSESHVRRYGLVTKWRNQVSDIEISQAAAIMRLFGIDAYEAEDIVAKPAYLLFPDTPKLLEAYRRTSERAAEAAS